MLELCTTDDPFQMLVSHLHQTERKLFLLPHHAPPMVCHPCGPSSQPRRLAGRPPRHSGVATAVPDLQHGPHAPSPSLPVRTASDSVKRIFASRTRRYAIPAAPVAATSESLSPILDIRVDELRVAQLMSCTQCRAFSRGCCRRATQGGLWSRHDHMPMFPTTPADVLLNKDRTVSRCGLVSNR